MHSAQVMSRKCGAALHKYSYMPYPYLVIPRATGAHAARVLYICSAMRLRVLLHHNLEYKYI